MKVRTFFIAVFSAMFVLGSVPFFVSYYDAKARVRTVHTLEGLKSYNDSIMALGLQIRGIQNAFIRAALEETAAGPDMDKLRDVVVKRNGDLDKLFADADVRFNAVAILGGADDQQIVSKDNFDRFMSSSRAYQSAIAKVLQGKEFSTKAIDEVAPFINAALTEVGKEVKASNDHISASNSQLLSQGQDFRQIYVVANGVILAIIVLAFVLMDMKIFRRLTIALADVEQVTSGDLRIKTTDKASDEFSRLLQAIGDMARELGKLIHNIDAEASRLHENAESIHDVSENVMAAASQQADATATMAAAIEELTVSSAHIADRTGDTERYSSNSVAMSVNAADQLDKTNVTIHQIAESVIGASGQISALNERAGQISNIASVIKEIAGQTNLLALNAAIEAARAGEQGRGFAVVADEVRKLAERTANATSEIESMIVGIQKDTGDAVGTMSLILPKVEEGKQMTSAAAESLASIRNESQQTLIQIREISGAIREQSAANSSLAQQVEVVANMAEQTSAKSRTNTDIAGQLRDMAGKLRSQISHFTL